MQLWNDFDDFYLDDLYGDGDDDSGPYRKQIKTCQFCGKRNLHWEQAGGQYRLAEPDGEFHECDPNAKSPCTEGFEDLTK